MWLIYESEWLVMCVSIQIMKTLVLSKESLINILEASFACYFWSENLI